MLKKWPSVAFVAPCLNTTWRRNIESHHTFDKQSVRTKIPFTCEVKTIMSRLRVNNHHDLDEIIVNYFTSENRSSHRVLVVIDLSPVGWLSEFAQPRGIVCTATKNHVDHADRVTAFLGSEHTILAHETNDPLDASLLAALAGTIVFAGILVIAVPFAVCDSGQVQIPDSNKLPFTPKAPTVSLFGRRFARLLDEAERRAPDNIILCRYEITADSHTSSYARQIDYIQRPEDPIHASLRARDEQALLLRKACDYLDSNHSSCISIVGKRGRGKTALTAHIANWLHSRHIAYRITAMHKSALSTFHKMTDHASIEYFIPVQELHKCDVATLLVDEASNTSIDLLRNLMIRHQRLILSTTVEGYESSGRAFELRTQNTIKQNFKSQLRLAPKEPWRWLANDPIESLIDSLVLNETACTPQPASLLDADTRQCFDKRHISIRKVSQQELFEDEKALADVFGLLRQTHYQSSVKDLQHLLDGKDLQLWVLRGEHHRQLLPCCF